MVFLFIVFIIFTFIIITAKIEVEIINLVIDSQNKNYVNDRYKIILRLRIWGKLPIMKLTITKQKLKKIRESIKIEEKIKKLEKKLGATIIKLGPSSNTFINILDIREESLEEDQKGYLATKIDKLIGFFKLIIQDLQDEEKSVLENAIIKTYKEKGINFDDESSDDMDNDATYYYFDFYGAETTTDQTPDTYYSSTGGGTQYFYANDKTRGQ